MLIQVYYGIEYPYMQFMIWGCAAKKYLKRIQVLQNKIVKTVFKSNKLKIQISLLYINHLKLLKLDKIHDLRIAKFMYEMKVKSLSWCDYKLFPINCYNSLLQYLASVK